jgi:hypothetical protein
MAADDATTAQATTLRVELAADDADRSALRQALLRARATELAEVRRLEVRLSAGYGDATTRAAMSGEVDRARKRWTMLGRLLDGLGPQDRATG